LDAKTDWIEPEFGLITFGFDVNVGRLIVLIAKEEKSVALNA